MNVDCPKCQKQLKLGEKAESSIAAMPAGKLVKVKCVQCSNIFGINSSGEAVNLNTPAAVEDSTKEDAALRGDGKSTGVSVKPPEPPDLSWLVDGIYNDHEVVEEIPLALVLMNESDARTGVINAIEGIGYKAETAVDATEAIEKMMFVNYSNVVLHSRFDGPGINSSQFHKYMTAMDMSKRRYIFYALIGPEFKTLYNLQALAYSANLVVNDKEIKDFNVILRRVIPEYEALFGPLMEELHIQRK